MRRRPSEDGAFQMPQMPQMPWVHAAGGPGGHQPGRRPAQRGGLGLCARHAPARAHHRLRRRVRAGTARADDAAARLAQCGRGRRPPDRGAARIAQRGRGRVSRHADLYHHLRAPARRRNRRGCAAGRLCRRGRHARRRKPRSRRRPGAQRGTGPACAGCLHRLAAATPADRRLRDGGRLLRRPTVAGRVGQQHLHRRRTRRRARPVAARGHDGSGT